MGHKISKKSKGTHSATATIPRSSQSASLLIATLSWETGTGKLSRQAFLETLKATRRKERIDLIVCSGRTLAKAPPPADILAASNDIPVLFESKHAEGNEWRIAFKSKGKDNSIQLRSQQVVENYDSGPFALKKLARILATGGGIFGFSGVKTRLALLICGENNGLDYNSKSSVIKRGAGMSFPDLSKDWILINPSHKPYKNETVYSGYAKVAQTKNGQGPTLGKIVYGKGRRRNGTIPPRAALHCNNVNLDKPFTKKYCSVLYAKPMRTPDASRRPSAKLAGTNVVPWFWRLYEVPVKLAA